MEVRLVDGAGDGFCLSSGNSIYRGFSEILTYWKISWEIDQKIVVGKGFVLVASPLRYDQGIVAIQIETTVESSVPSYKRAY